MLSDVWLQILWPNNSVQRWKQHVPFQFALSTRAGTDCVEHAVRAATDMNLQMTVLSIDGIGAYDHLHRSAMLAKLLETPSLHGLLPIVWSTYAGDSCYKWVDEDGAHHDIRQAEGGEQGDPLMPLLFSLAIHNALQEVQEQLHPGELLFASLDVVYAVAAPDRIRPIYDLLGAKLFERAGIRLHTGKTRTWNRAGQRPPDMEDLGPEVWSQEGVKILGTPLGSDVFIATGRGETVGGSVVGVSFSSVRDLVATTTSGPWPPVSPGSMPKATTRECGRQLRG